MADPDDSAQLGHRQHRRYDDNRHRRYEDTGHRDSGWAGRWTQEDAGGRHSASRWQEKDVDGRRSERYPDQRDKRRDRSDDWAGSSRRDGSRTGHGDTHVSERSRRRSRSPITSPDFARDRARERDAYDQRHGTGPSSGAAADDDAQGANTPNMEPNFGSSGLLAKESNSKNGVTLKYFEPPEARKPKRKWRLYVFKDGKEVDLMHISRQSCYLIGRDHAVVDIPVDHASISKQHAVIQFRSMTERNEFGDEKRATKPFLIDLDSANGCSVNGRDIPASRYYELRKGDTIRLGGSSREYVLLSEE